MPNELSSKDGRALGDELGEDQECWHGGSDGHIFVSDVNKGAKLRPTVRAPIPTQGLLTPNVSGSARPDGSPVNKLTLLSLSVLTKVMAAGESTGLIII